MLQPNDSPEPLRRWALSAGFALQNEQMVEGFWRYGILTLQRGTCTAYAGLPLEPALRYGPLLLKARHPLLKAHLQERQRYLQKLVPVEKVRAELEVLEQALELFGA